MRIPNEIRYVYLRFKFCLIPTKTVNINNSKKFNAINLCKKNNNNFSPQQHKRKMTTACFNPLAMVIGKTNSNKSRYSWNEIV